MRIPKDEFFKKLLIATIIEYCNQSLFPLIVKNKVQVKCEIIEDKEFNAVVLTCDCLKYDILINVGIINSIIDVINSLNNSDIDEEIILISKGLLNDANKKDDIYRALVYGATFFIIFHELAHIFRGHFHFSIENKLLKFDYPIYSFKEITKKEPPKIDLFNGNFLKLVELDADISSMLIFLQISLELFASTSDCFVNKHPNWRDETSPQLRNICNKLAYYSASLAMSLIEVNRNNNGHYPMPLTRFLNLSETYKQEVYRIFEITTTFKYRGELQWFTLSDKQMVIQDEYILMPFLSAIDIIIETSKLKKKNIYHRFGNEEVDMYKSLLDDFGKLMKTLVSDSLITQEAIEYQNLKRSYPDFLSIFKDFIIFDSSLYQ